MNLETKKLIPNHDKPWICKDCKLQKKSAAEIIKNCPADTNLCLWYCDICNKPSSIYLNPPNLRERKITKSHAEMLNLCEKCTTKLDNKK